MFKFSLRKWSYLVGFLALIPSLSSCGYNGMVSREQAVESSWAQVQNVYQRRADLIPNLIKTVQGEANFERGTLEAVISARASATQVRVDPDQLTPENIAKVEAAQASLGGALSRLLSVVENYPNLRSNTSFQELRAQLEGSENRITIERQKFNETVQDYNTFIKRFPNNLFSGMFGFSKKGYFEAAAGSDVAPSVPDDFGTYKGPPANPSPTSPPVSPAPSNPAPAR